MNRKKKTHKHAMERKIEKRVEEKPERCRLSVKTLDAVGNTDGLSREGTDLMGTL